MYLARPVHSLHLCSKQLFYWMSISSPNLMPLLEFLISSKIFSHWLDLHFHAPIYAAEASKSIPLVCFRHMRDCLCIHATRNTVIPCIIYAIGGVHCTHMPWHIVNFHVSMVYGTQVLDIVYSGSNPSSLRSTDWMA